MCLHVHFFFLFLMPRCSAGTPPWYLYMLSLLPVYAQFTTYICSVYYLYMLSLLPIYAQFTTSICSVYYLYMIRLLPLYAQFTSSICLVYYWCTAIDFEYTKEISLLLMYRSRRTLPLVTPYTLHPTPHTLNPTPHTLHPTPYAINPTSNPKPHA